MKTKFINPNDKTIDLDNLLNEVRKPSKEAKINAKKQAEEEAKNRAFFDKKKKTQVEVEATKKSHLESDLLNIPYAKYLDDNGNEVWGRKHPVTGKIIPFESTSTKSYDTHIKVGKAAEDFAKSKGFSSHEEYKIWKDEYDKNKVIPGTPEWKEEETKKTKTEIEAAKRKAAQEELFLKSGETPEQTADRLKKEKIPNTPEWKAKQERLKTEKAAADKARKANTPGTPEYLEKHGGNAPNQIEEPSELSDEGEEAYVDIEDPKAKILDPNKISGIDKPLDDTLKATTKKTEEQIQQTEKEKKYQERREKIIKQVDWELTEEDSQKLIKETAESFSNEQGTDKDKFIQKYVKEKLNDYIVSLQNPDLIDMIFSSIVDPLSQIGLDNFKNPHAIYNSEERESLIKPRLKKIAGIFWQNKMIPAYSSFIDFLINDLEPNVATTKRYFLMLNTDINIPLNQFNSLPDEDKQNITKIKIEHQENIERLLNSKWYRRVIEEAQNNPTIRNYTNDIESTPEAVINLSRKELLGNQESLKLDRPLDDVEGTVEYLIEHFDDAKNKFILNPNWDETTLGFKDEQYEGPGLIQINEILEQMKGRVGVGDARKAFTNSKQIVVNRLQGIFEIIPREIYQDVFKKTKLSDVRSFYKDLIKEYTQLIWTYTGKESKNGMATYLYTELRKFYLDNIEKYKIGSSTSPMSYMLEPQILFDIFKSYADIVDIVGVPRVTGYKNVFPIIDPDSEWKKNLDEISGESIQARIAKSLVAKYSDYRLTPTKLFQKESVLKKAKFLRNPKVFANQLFNLIKLIDQGIKTNNNQLAFNNLSTLLQSTSIKITSLDAYKSSDKLPEKDPSSELLTSLFEQNPEIDRGSAFVGITQWLYKYIAPFLYGLKAEKVSSSNIQGYIKKFVNELYNNDYIRAQKILYKIYDIDKIKDNEVKLRKINEADNLFNSILSNLSNFIKESFKDIIQMSDVHVQEQYSTFEEEYKVEQEEKLNKLNKKRIKLTQGVKVTTADGKIKTKIYGLVEIKSIIDDYLQKIKIEQDKIDNPKSTPEAKLEAKNKIHRYIYGRPKKKGPIKSGLKYFERLQKERNQQIVSLSKRINELEAAAETGFKVPEFTEQTFKSKKKEESLASHFRKLGSEGLELEEGKLLETNISNLQTLLIQALLGSALTEPLGKKVESERLPTGLSTEQGGFSSRTLSASDDEKIKTGIQINNILKRFPKVKNEIANLKSFFGFSSRDNGLFAARESNVMFDLIQEIYEAIIFVINHNTEKIQKGIIEEAPQDFYSSLMAEVDDRVKKNIKNITRHSRWQKTALTRSTLDEIWSRINNVLADVLSQKSNFLQKQLPNIENKEKINEIKKKFQITNMNADEWYDLVFSPNLTAPDTSDEEAIIEYHLKLALRNRIENVIHNRCIHQVSTYQNNRPVRFKSDGTYETISDPELKQDIAVIDKILFNDENLSENEKAFYKRRRATLENKLKQNFIDIADLKAAAATLEQKYKEEIKGWIKAKQTEIELDHAKGEVLGTNEEGDEQRLQDLPSQGGVQNNVIKYVGVLPTVISSIEFYLFNRTFEPIKEDRYNFDIISINKCLVNIKEYIKDSLKSFDVLDEKIKKPFSVQKIIKNIFNIRDNFIKELIKKWPDLPRERVNNVKRMINLKIFEFVYIYSQILGTAITSIKNINNVNELDDYISDLQNEDILHINIDAQELLELNNYSIEQLVSILKLDKIYESECQVLASYIDSGYNLIPTKTRNKVKIELSRYLSVLEKQEIGQPEDFILKKEKDIDKSKWKMEGKNIVSYITKDGEKWYLFNKQWYPDSKVQELIQKTNPATQHIPQLNKLDDTEQVQTSAHTQGGVSDNNRGEIGATQKLTKQQLTSYGFKSPIEYLETVLNDYLDKDIKPPGYKEKEIKLTKPKKKKEIVVKGQEELKPIEKLEKQIENAEQLTGIEKADSIIENIIDDYNSLRKTKNLSKLGGISKFKEMANRILNNEEVSLIEDQEIKDVIYNNCNTIINFKGQETDKILEYMVRLLKDTYGLLREANIIHVNDKNLAQKPIKESFNNLSLEYILNSIIEAISMNPSIKDLPTNSFKVSSIYLKKFMPEKFRQMNSIKNSCKNKYNIRNHTCYVSDAYDQFIIEQPDSELDGETLNFFIPKSSLMIN